MTHSSSLVQDDERLDNDMFGAAHMVQSQRFSVAAGVEQQLRLVGRSAGKGGEACQLVLAVSVRCTANTG